MNRGGPRPGAGRPAGATGKAKKPVNVRLPLDIVDWLKLRQESQASLIETALRAHYRLSKSSTKGDQK